MILDRIENADRYYSLHSSFPLVFSYLNTNIPTTSDRIELDDDRVFVLFSQQQGKKRRETFLEAHRRYIDVHICFDGIEEIGWRALESCVKIDKNYNDEKDFITFGDEPESWCTLHPNSFAIFFPEDAHAPMVSEGVVKKAVVKVAV